MTTVAFKTGDILHSDAEALVNTVNCVGIMGRGIARQFKEAFPANFAAYAAACNRKEVQPGRLFWFETGFMANPKYIVNFPTKRHWRGKSRMEDIDAGLQALVVDARQRGIRSIAIPPLGSGLGGLDWAHVKPRIAVALAELPDMRAEVYEPLTPPVSEKSASGRSIPAMTAGRAALIELMHRYLDGLLDPFVTLLEVHKLMYFMQEAGQPLRLRYVKGPYGPYAENLRHVLREIDGYFVSGYFDGGDAPDKELQLVPGAAGDAESFLADHPDTLQRFERVAELVEGFESPFGLELLATVHWTAQKDGTGNLDLVAAGVYAWNERKRRFSRRQIGVALKTLCERGWLGSNVSRELAAAR